MYIRANCGRQRGSAIDSGSRRSNFIFFGWAHLLLIPLTGWLVFTGPKKDCAPGLHAYECAGNNRAMTPLSLAWEVLPLIRQVQFGGSLRTAPSFCLYLPHHMQLQSNIVATHRGSGVTCLLNLAHIGFEKYYPIASEWTPDAIVRMQSRRPRMLNEPDGFSDVG